MNMVAISYGNTKADIRIWEARTGKNLLENIERKQSPEFIDLYRKAIDAIRPVEKKSETAPLDTNEKDTQL